MTAIACNRQMMAADSLAVGDGTKSRTIKIFRVGHEIVGFAGELQCGIAFVNWYRDRSAAKPDLDNFAALVLSKDGITQYENRLIPIPILEKFAAIGSGQDAALAAMYAGKSPKEAAAIACKVRADCGTPIKVMTLDP